jgi:cell division protein FtsB
MSAVKQTALRLLLGLELISIAFFYLLSSGGLVALRHAHTINTELHQEIQQLEADISQLTTELDERKQNPFYRESIARKELQMAYTNETVYLLPES